MIRKRKGEAWGRRSCYVIEDSGFDFLSDFVVFFRVARDYMELINGAVEESQDLQNQSISLHCCYQGLYEGSRDDRGNAADLAKLKE